MTVGIADVLLTSSPLAPGASPTRISYRDIGGGSPMVILHGGWGYDAYPFDRLKGKLSLLVIHGDQDTTNPIAASQKMADAAKAAGVDTTYATVPGGTHLEAYLTYASQIFDFLDAHKK